MENLNDLIEPDHDIHGVAERLRLARQHAGLSQAEFAERIGYSRRQVNCWENGINVLPIWALKAVRREFNIDPEWVLSGPGKKPLQHAKPQDADRTTKLMREVVSLAADAGLKLDATIITSLAQQIAREPVEVEPEAKRHTLAMLRAISLGTVTKL